MRAKLIVAVFIATLLTQPLLAFSKTGMIISGVAAGATGISLLVSGIVMGVAGHEEYCPDGTQKAVSGSYDCSYQVCGAYLYNGGYYYCNDYYDTYYGYTESCQYTNGGYTQCMAWVTVPDTCYTYACQDPNTQQFTPLQYRKSQPTYDNSRIATIVSGAAFGASIIGIIVSAFAGSN